MYGPVARSRRTYARSRALSQLSPVSRTNWWNKGERKSRSVIARSASARRYGGIISAG